ncbi:hypothetical protein K435DRAFT_425001 [Dendrothele bispora CBS 962.96]|uniref:Uncharacterized protein n=1 Tax=Dendrothele bispora (strain CBS 962.96) TaxID=1314807 RepID=A0A4S8MEB8_DENBC|nr:hypothetical protein K435DRAFT_425001 [Dendrothele bispora CBS 962.96]
MLDIDCSTVSLPEFLPPIYTLTPLLDYSSYISCCVFSETTSFPDHNSSSSQLSNLESIHLSTPHPLADIDTPQQAAVIFSLSGVRSLLVSGRLRSAFDEATDCVESANPNMTYFKTDLAHDVHERSTSQFGLSDPDGTFMEEVIHPTLRLYTNTRKSRIDVFE